MIGLRTHPDLSSHCEIILKPKSKVKILCKRDAWYQVLYETPKKYEGWIPASAILDQEPANLHIKSKPDDKNLTNQFAQKSILKKESVPLSKNIMGNISAKPMTLKRKVKLNNNTEIVFDFRGKKVKKASYKSQLSFAKKNTNTTGAKYREVDKLGIPWIIKSDTEIPCTKKQGKIKKNKDLIRNRTAQRNFSEIKVLLSKIPKNPKKS